MMRWYVARAHPGMEETAERNLLRQGLDEGSVFAPGTALRRSVFNRTKAMIFPGYVFVRLDLDADICVLPWQRINHTRGVIRLLPSHLERPSPLPLGFIEELMVLVDDGEFDESRVVELIKRFAPGELVSVISGPLAGRSLDFVRYHKGALICLTSLLGKEIEVPIREHQVLKIRTMTRVRAPQYRRGPRQKCAGAVAS